MDFEDMQRGLQVQDFKDKQKLSPQESDKWEMDVDVTLDNLYHGWLGQKQVSGEWVDDPMLIKRMNKEGASFLISEIRPRFNINSQFSVLPIERIDEISSLTAENIMNKLKYDYWKYDIKPNDLKLICEQIFDCLYIWLMISYNGGMREYKGMKTKTIISKQENNGGVY